MENYKLTHNPYTGEIGEYVMKMSDGSLAHQELNQQYLQWLAEGNEPEPADATPVADTQGEQ